MSIIQTVEHNRHEDVALQRVGRNALTTSGQQAYHKRPNRIGQSSGNFEKLLRWPAGAMLICVVRGRNTRKAIASRRVTWQCFKFENFKLTDRPPRATEHATFASRLTVPIWSVVLFGGREESHHLWLRKCMRPPKGPICRTPAERYCSILLFHDDVGGVGHDATGQLAFPCTLNPSPCGD
jgi:hypothetical protein